jgi:hypothetical protein
MGLMVVAADVGDLLPIRAVMADSPVAVAVDMVLLH